MGSSSDAGARAGINTYIKVSSRTSVDERRSRMAGRLAGDHEASDSSREPGGGRTHEDATVTRVFGGSEVHLTGNRI